jgi:hypothetical protein
MRTTVRLDPALLREAKQLAAREGRTLTALIDEALRHMLTAKRRRARPSTFEVRPFKGTGLAPGVDLDDSAALLELMEQGLPLDKRR